METLAESGIMLFVPKMYDIVWSAVILVIVALFFYKFFLPKFQAVFDERAAKIAGGIAKEPGCDLSIVAALASAAKHTPIARTTCAIGEISLTGQVRPVPRLEYRLREAARLGFTTAVTPVLRKRVSVAGLNIIQVDSLRDALESLGLAGR